MKILLIIAAAGATWLGGQRTPLSPLEAEDLGINITAVNHEEESDHPYPQYAFVVELGQFDACKLGGVWVSILNDSDQLVYSASIQGESGRYSFQLLEEFLATATLGIICDAGPDVLDPGYTIELGGYLSSGVGQ